MDDLLVDFLTETNESLAELDTALVKLERTPDDSQTLSLIFRLVHTIKGTCGFLGLPRLERVAHAAESVLGRVRDGTLPVTPELVSTVLSAIDRIKEIVKSLASTETESNGDDTALIAALDAVAEGRAAGPVSVPVPVAEAAPVPEEVIVVPPASVAVPDTAIAPAKQIESRSADVSADSATDTAGASQTIRVGVDVLEDLMTLVSELVLTRNQLLQLARTQDSGSETMGRFTVPLQRLSHITSDLQEGVMKTRMQPIGHAWNKLPRLVRDLARDLDKKIELVMLGADTELDRQVLELIKDPLTHMVRNSGDHGLETPGERRSAGKPESGRITLNAYHEGGHIIIEIGDDGRGLPVDKIRTKLVSKGLATEAELAAMTDIQIQSFIFRAGFSTAASVTAVSGRGVGMDVVKTNIERIGGTIDLKSTAGQGTVFTIKIPLTLAIVSALIVEAGHERFAIPQISVVELVRCAARTDPNIAEDDDAPRLERIDDTAVLRLRNNLLPLVNLTDLLQLGEPATASASEEGLYIVVAQVGPNMLGIVVDRVFDTEEIVVKPVAPILRHITMFTGNTILGDGSVIMILDPNGIARATGIVGSGDARVSQAKAPEDPRSIASSRRALLLFRAGGEDPKSVPLGLVARLENIPRKLIEFSGGHPVTQYRGKLMPLVAMSGAFDMARENFAVLVFTDTDQARQRGQSGDRCMGLVVDEIVDVVEDELRIELSGDRPGLLGSAVIAGRATDVIDTGYWLQQAHQDWFLAREGGGTAQSVRLLVVEDSDFFRQLLVPILAAAGYDVVEAQDAAAALRMRDAGVMVDVIVSDIEMPDMDGIAFVRALRASGAWADLPVIALTAHSRSGHIEAGRAAGFTDYVLKFERDALLSSLRQCLAMRTETRSLA